MIINRMNNKDLHYSDFKMAGYQNLLKLALIRGFVFSDYNTQEMETGRTIVWRHDLEFSVHRALKMAQIESEIGVIAQYFVQIHSIFYNTFEKEIFDLLIKIKKLGHRLGLHFDAHFWNIENEDQLEFFIQRDKRILEDLLDIEVKSFSFHNTTPTLLEMDKLYYGGILNVYAAIIRRKYRYCSDSTGIWRYERLQDVLNDGGVKHLQVLTHDGMWQDEAMAPRQRVLRCIKGRSEKVINRYDNLLKRLGLLNADE